MKKGEMTIGQIVKLILAVAVVFILLTLLFKLFVPFYDKGDETAKSYFETLKNEIAIADKEGAGEFFMWYMAGPGFNEEIKDEDIIMKMKGEIITEFYLVYFGDGYSVDVEKQRRDLLLLQNQTYQFNSLGDNKNRICICTSRGSYDTDYETDCRYCEDLKHPVEFSDKKESSWYYKGGSRIKIELKGDKYVFTKI